MPKDGLTGSNHPPEGTPGAYECLSVSEGLEGLGEADHNRSYRRTGKTRYDLPFFGVVWVPRDELMRNLNTPETHAWHAFTEWNKEGFRFIAQIVTGGFTTMRQSKDGTFDNPQHWRTLPLPEGGRCVVCNTWLEQGQGRLL